MAGAAGFNHNEKRYDCSVGEPFKERQRYIEELNWDFKINILGVKDSIPVHFCNKCKLPIKIYGRIIPCKHAFCYACAVLHGKEGDKTCPGCSNPVKEIEKHKRGSLFMCCVVQGCEKMYLSQRDLEAHINHRHMRA